MVNINLNTLGSEELVKTAQNMMNEYETKKVTGAYGGTDLRDLQHLEKSLQRAVFEGIVRGDQRPAEAHSRVKAILESDASMKFTKEDKTVKSISEVMRDQNGYGRYNVK